MTTDIAPPAPPAPTNLVVTGTTTTSTSLSWTGVNGANDYVILRGPTSGSETQLTSNSPETATTYTDKHETPGTQYCFEIKSIINGVYSGPSNETCSTTTAQVPTPTGVTATAISSSQITVSWTAVTGANRYVVLDRVGNNGAFATATSVDGSTTTAEIEGLQAGTTYQFEVETQINNQTSPPSTPPASATTFDSGVEAYYKFDDKTGTTAADSSGEGRNGTLATGAEFGSDRAPLEDGSGHNFSALTLPTATAVATFPNVPVAFATTSSISLWVKLTATPTGTVAIFGKRDPGCGAVSWLIGQDTANGLFFQGAAITPFGTSLQVGVWTQLAAVLSGGTLTLYVNGQQTATAAYTQGTATTASLQAGDVGTCGNGGALIVDETKLLSRALSAAEVAALGTPPPAPTNLAQVGAHSTRVNLQWDAVSTATDYFVYRGSAAGNETFLTSNSTTTFDGDHLTPNQSTSWQVYAINANGLISAPSNELLVTTLAAPPAPATLTATLNTCCEPNRVNLSWASVDRAVSYVVLRSTDGTTFTAIGTTQSPTTTFTAAGLQTGTTYTFEVEDEDDGSTLSAPSPTAQATPN